ncbi:unnamed protein product [Gadus morhua 'NCC']
MLQQSQMSPDTFRTSPVEQAPAVPFSGHINEGLRVGKRLIVVGVVEPRPDRFYILLSCGPGLGQRPPSDVALELCVLMKESQVLCRACVGALGRSGEDRPLLPLHRPPAVQGH